MIFILLFFPQRLWLAISLPPPKPHFGGWSGRIRFKFLFWLNPLAASEAVATATWSVMIIQVDAIVIVSALNFNPLFQVLASFPPIWSIFFWGSVRNVFFLWQGLTSSRLPIQLASFGSRLPDVSRRLVSLLSRLFYSRYDLSFTFCIFYFESLSRL